MSTQTVRGLISGNSADTSDETAVADYLERHADFFERHQAVLARLVLPHVRGTASVSLVERQVEVLRERQSQSDARLAEFIEVARANEQLAQKLHTFTRRLLRAHDLLEILAQIEASLREDFDASLARLVLVREQSIEGASATRFLRCVSAEDPILRSFESLFAIGKPRCGQVRDMQRDYLFSDEANDVGSVALVPLGANGTVGLLAVGSNERDRFHPGMSTDFLARMSELISDALTR